MPANGCLAVEDFLDVANLLLNLAADFLTLAFALQIRIVGRFTHLFLDRADRLVGLASELVFGAFFNRL